MAQIPRVKTHRKNFIRSPRNCTNLTCSMSGGGKEIIIMKKKKKKTTKTPPHHQKNTNEVG